MQSLKVLKYFVLIYQFCAVGLFQICIIELITKLGQIHDMFIEPHERSEWVDTKSYQGLAQHFWSLNDQSDHFLIESDHKSKALAGRPRK